jgi:AcrR family transcriptional regulator
MEYSKRQIEIIEAATALIGEKGMQNLTTKNLAAQMGFSEPALYRHFKNKTDIIHSVLVYYRILMKEGLESLLINSHTGKDKVKDVIDFQFSHFSKHPAVVMVIFSETSLQHDDVLSKMVLSILDQKKEVLEEIIALGQKDLTIRTDITPSQFANIIMGSMRFTILRWRLNDFNFNLIKEGEALWNTVSKILACPNK